MQIKKSLRFSSYQSAKTFHFTVGIDVSSPSRHQLLTLHRWFFWCSGFESKAMGAASRRPMGYIVWDACFWDAQSGV